MIYTVFITYLVTAIIIACAAAAIDARAGAYDHPRIYLLCALLWPALILTHWPVRLVSFVARKANPNATQRWRRMPNPASTGNLSTVPPAPRGPRPIAPAAPPKRSADATSD